MRGEKSRTDSRIKCVVFLFPYERSSYILVVDRGEWCGGPAVHHLQRKIDALSRALMFA